MGEHSPLPVLPSRADFLRVTHHHKKHVTPGFILQVHHRDDKDPARVGFTASKKVGNAVKRNKAKRRLRELARLTLKPLARPGTDYVLIARAATLNRPFNRLQEDLRTCFPPSK